MILDELVVFYILVTYVSVLLEEPGGPGPAEDYTNLHKNIENKI